MVRLWMTRAGSYGELANLFITGCYVSVGYGITSNVMRLASRAEFRQACGQASRDDRWSTVSANGDSLHRFVTMLSIGDYVVMPIDREIVRYGILVNADPYFVKQGTDEDTHCTRRRVHWAVDPISRSDCSVDFQKALDAQGTVFSLQPYAGEFFNLIGQTSLADVI
jgi:predicted Mrr-cat superfamily restriction endonuclease